MMSFCQKGRQIIKCFSVCDIPEGIDKLGDACCLIWRTCLPFKACTKTNIQLTFSYNNILNQAFAPSSALLFFPN